MIVSHEHEYIFVKIPKTGSSSVEMILNGDLGYRDTATRGNWNGSGQNVLESWSNPHMTINHAVMAGYISEDQAREYTKVAVARNCYDRLVSWFWFLKSARRYNPLLCSDTPISEVRKAFTAWLFDVEKQHPQVFYGTESYFAADLKPDVYLWYAQLGPDLKRFMDEHGIRRDPGHTDPRINSRFRTHWAHYSQYYTEEAFDFASKKFKDELVTLPWKFERKEYK